MEPTQAMNKVKGRYSCEICSKSFGKAEHLNRHRGTHTDSKPYPCSICGQKFTRPDSAVRHEKGHRRRHDRLSTRLAGEPNHDRLSSTTSAVTEPSPSSEPRLMRVENVVAPLSEDPQSVSTTAPLMDGNAQASLSTNIIDHVPNQHLNWPDSEALLQSILSADFGTWPQSSSSDVLALPFHAGGNQAPATIPGDEASPWTSEAAVDVGQGGSYAVRDLTRIISNLSADITAQADTTGLTPIFLDGCLHMFFENFIPMFPVVHKPTFVFSESTHPLLLNAIALGSLFMGSAADIAKGEFLWRLAHTVVATLWPSLINHKGPYDSCRGVQLVMTALLGQVYAILSKNTNLRKTAQVFHSLGFYWARECGMYDTVAETHSDLLDDCHSVEDMTEVWRRWAASETQLRAVLGHYILDGQISQYTGFPPCQRHAANTLCMPTAPTIFHASTVEEWSTEMRTARGRIIDFESVLGSLLQLRSELPSGRLLHDDISLCSLSAKVLSEAIKCFICEIQSSKTGKALGAIPRADISRAMGRLYRLVLQSDQMSRSEKVEIMIRWHLIGIDLLVDSRRLCRNICLQENNQQDLFNLQPVAGPQAYDDIKAWCETPGARCALLHANAIHGLIHDLPNTYMASIHMPACLFTAAAIYYSFIRIGYLKMPLPEVIDWENLLTLDPTTRLSESPDVQSTIWQYLNASSDPMSGAWIGDLRCPSQSLLYNFYDLAKHLRGAATGPWGISAELSTIVEQWVAGCNSRF